MKYFPLKFFRFLTGSMSPILQFHISFWLLQIFRFLTGRMSPILQLHILFWLPRFLTSIFQLRWPWEKPSAGLRKHFAFVSHPTSIGVPCLLLLKDFVYFKWETNRNNANKCPVGLIYCMWGLVKSRNAFSYLSAVEQIGVDCSTQPVLTS
jgi:hypothetical protein